MNKYTIPTPQTDLQATNSIIFYNNLDEKNVEVLRISKEGITANPDVPVDEAAQAILRALDGYIKEMVRK